MNEPHDPFAVDPERALAALMFTWQDQCDEIWQSGDEWHAHRRGGDDDDVITASTPDALNVKLREDWLRREAGRG